MFAGLLKKEEQRYLKPNRLGDVLAAIQTMAVYQRYRVSCETWAFKISGDKKKAGYWKAVFNDHPEFFRPAPARPNNYSLVWRQASPRRYNPKTQAVVTEEQYAAMSDLEKKKLSRQPISESQIKTLTDIALNLHSKELESVRDWRWWFPPAASFGAAVLTAMFAFIAAWQFRR
jgi:hypothetical protein